MRTHYLIPDPLDADLIESRLSDQAGLNLEAVRQEKRSFLDSFDWRLYRNGMVLEDHVDGKQHHLLLRTLHSGEPLARGQTTRSPAFTHDLPAGRLRELLAPVLEMRELQPLAVTRVNVRSLHMLNSDDKTVARVQIEQTVPSGRRRSHTGRLPARVSVTAVRGYHKPAARVTKNLLALGLTKTRQDPYLELLSAAGVTPGDYASKLELHLEPGMRGDQASRIILHTLLDTVLQNEAGTRRGTDTEFLHDFRVAVRRTRSALTQIKGVLPQRVLERYKREFAWLGSITGNTRDLDVYLLTFDDYRDSLPQSVQNDIEPLRTFLERNWQIEQKALVRALDSARYRRLIGSWRDFLEQPANERSTLPNARTPVYELACKRIWRIYRRILKEGRAITHDSPAEDFHELRKTAKKLRYLLEFFQCLFPADSMKKLIGALKKLQNNLGDYQDYEVQVQTMKRFSQQMMEENMAPAGTLLAMGMLIEGLERRQHQARENFFDIFTTFSRPENEMQFRELFANCSYSGNRQ